MEPNSGATLLQDVWRDLRHAVRVLGRARRGAALRNCTRKKRNGSTPPASSSAS
jgi:hypothetical protein